MGPDGLRVKAVCKVLFSIKNIIKKSLLGSDKRGMVGAY